MFSCGTFLFVNTRDRAELERRVNFVRGLEGIQHVEVWLEPGDWTKSDTIFLRTLLGDLPVIVHAPFINLTLVSDHGQLNQASLDILKRAADGSVELGAEVFTIHLGRKPTYITPERAMEDSGTYVSKLIQYIDNRMKVSLENMPPSKGTAPSFPVSGEEVESCLHRTPGLMTTVDIGHYVLDGVAPLDFIRHNLQSVADIHLHNVSRGGREHFGFNEPGDVNARHIVQSLISFGYTGYVSLEVFTDRPQDTSESWVIVQNARLIKSREE
ncbi:MAG: sugar phosphate isomerase/epimerase [Patescibacteria group bacterium]